MKLLLDANLSPETRAHLVALFAFDVIDLQTEHLGALSDNEVVQLAKREGRVIVTFDLDFGEIYYLRDPGAIGAIILRLSDQTIESVNRALTRFFQTDAAGIDLAHSLVVIEERRIRILRSPA